MKEIKISQAMMKRIKKENENEVFHEIEEELFDCSNDYDGINKPHVFTFRDVEYVIYYNMKMRNINGKKEYSFSISAGDIVEVNVIPPKNNSRYK